MTTGDRNERARATGFRNALLASMGLLDHFTPEERAGYIPRERLETIFARSVEEDGGE